MKTYEAIARLFRDEGVDTVFTLMSGDIIGILSEIESGYGDEIDVVSVRHEQGAAAMADGYSRAGDGIGVCLVGRGPAIAQTGTSLVTARNRGSRVLYLVPDFKRFAVNDPKAFPQESYLESTAGEVVSIRSSKNVVSSLRDVFRRLRAGEGPLAVQVSWDVLEGELEEPVEFETGGSRRTGRASPSGSRLHPEPGDVRKALDLFRETDHETPPVILAGRGAVEAEARESLEELAESWNAFLLTTLQARSYFSGHPYHPGFVGGHGRPLANEYLAESKFVYAVGCSLNQHTTESGELIGDEARLVQVDVDRGRFDRFTSVDLALHGDARVTTEALVKEIDERGVPSGKTFWTEAAREEIAAQNPLGEERRTEEGVIDPRTLMERLDPVLPEDRLVVHDTGHAYMWVLDGITITHPDDHIWTLDFAAVGQGLPIAIGAAVSSDRTSLAFLGDGGFMMSLPELETAVREQIPLIVIVINDESVGAEYHMAKNDGFGGELALLSTPDFAEVAESLGAEGHTVRSAADVDRIANRIETKPSGPVVVDCRVNRAVLNRYLQNMTGI